MNRLDLFRRALLQVNELGTHYPSDAAVHSIRVQLKFLIALEAGERSDRERLYDIIIGILTLREIEPLDSAVAEVLYEVEEVVETMKIERN